MQLSKSVEYAIHGLIYLARDSGVQITLLGEIARVTGVPESYLRKVFQILSRRGIVLAQRGAKGGYLLSRAPAEINVREIVEAMEGSIPLYTCMSQSQKRCSIVENCPVKDVFHTASEKMYEILEKTSLKDILNGFLESGNKPEWLSVAIK